MKKNVFITICLLIVTYSGFSQIKLSDKATIGIFTCSPGHELYSTFGHSAIRVLDEENNLNWVFNYGTFNFHTPNFYGKFIKGRLNYQLTIEEYSSFERFYKKDERDVYEQILNLTQKEKQEVFDFLMWNAQEENRYYLYDFFWDNCATRIRDILIDMYGDDLILEERDWNVSFRDMIDNYLEDTPWIHFGIDLALGLPADSIVDNFYAQFLPDYMDTLCQSAVIKIETGYYPLIKERKQLIACASKDEIGMKRFFSPLMVFSFIFVVTMFLMYHEIKHKKRYYAIDAFFLFLFGFVGFFIAFLWFGTEHRGANYNLNIVWALPTHFIVAIMLLKNKKSAFVNKYIVIAGIYTILFVPFFSIFPQKLPIALIPLFLAFGIRTIGLFLTENKKQMSI